MLNPSVARGKIEGSENVIQKSKNGMYYIKGKDDKMLSKRHYKSISNFVNGLSVVTLKDKHKVHKVYVDGIYKREFDIYPKGVIDVNGREVLEPVYDEIRICDDSIRICVDQKWGYADLEGNIICEPCKDFVEKFKDGCARVRNGELWGVISYYNQFLIPEEYAYLGDLRDGKRVAKRGTNYGVIDNNGNIIEPFVYDKMKFIERIILTNSQTGETVII